MKPSELDEIVRKHFRLVKIDNLPYLASAPRDRRTVSGRKILAEMLSELNVREGVEIGVRKGGSTMVWCEHNPELHLTCIDPWAPYHGRRFGKNRQQKNYLEAVKNLAPLNVDILRMSSLEAIHKFENGSLDFVHIDGNHEFDFCCPDIIYWSYKLKSGGIIAIHDYCSFEWSGVMQAINAYTHCHNIRPWYVTRDKTPTAFWGRP